MRRRPSRLLTAAVAALVAVPLVAGCEAKVYGRAPAAPAGPQPPSSRRRAPWPRCPNLRPTSHGRFDGLEGRARQATADAADGGRRHRRCGPGPQDRPDRHQRQWPRTIAIASVVKLFIADDLLLQESMGQTQLSPADRAPLDRMLRSSDDSAAQNFWNRSGGNIIAEFQESPPSRLPNESRARMPVE